MTIPRDGDATAVPGDDDGPASAGRVPPDRAYHVTIVAMVTIRRVLEHLRRDAAVGGGGALLSLSVDSATVQPLCSGRAVARLR